MKAPASDVLASTQRPAQELLIASGAIPVSWREQGIPLVELESIGFLGKLPGNGRPALLPERTFSGSHKRD